MSRRDVRWTGGRPGATAAGGLVATAVGGLEADLGDSGPRAASGGHGAGVPSGGRRAANVQMGVVLCGERRTWSRERRYYGSASSLYGVRPLAARLG